jgi:hypothetical protein
LGAGTDPHFWVEFECIVNFSWHINSAHNILQHHVVCVCGFYFRLFGLSRKREYSDISDDDLDRVVQDVTKANPNGIGYRACRVLLKARGILVPYERVNINRINCNLH